MKNWKLITGISAALLFSLGSQQAFAGVCRDQPNMAAGLAALQEARADLAKAEHNKGGWRVAAIEALNKAIAEADRGCAFADTH